MKIIKEFFARRLRAKNQKKADAWELAHTPIPGRDSAIVPEDPKQHGVATSAFKLVGKSLDSATESKKEARSAVQRLMDKLSKP